MNIEELIESLKAIPALVAEVEKLRNEVRLLCLESDVFTRPANRKFLTLKDAAEQLNICTKSTRRLVDRGLLKSSKGMRCVRIPVEEIENYKRRTV